MVANHEVKGPTVAVPLTYASFHRRLFSMTIDIVAIYIIMTPVLGLLYAIKIKGLSWYDIIGHIQQYMSEDSQKNFSDLLQYIKDNKLIFRYLIIQVINAVAISLMILPLWLFKGMTPGKFITNTVLVNQADLKLPNLKQCLVRMFVFMLSIIPLGLGFIAIALNSKRRALYDMAAGTVVVLRRGRNFTK